MVNLGELVFSIIAEDKASTTVGAAAAKIGSAAKTAGLAMTGVGIASKLMADNINASAVPFNTALTSIRSIGAAAPEVDKIKDAALGISKSMPVAAQDIADSAYLIRSAGFETLDISSPLESGKNSLEALAKVAVAGGEELTGVTETVITVMGAYGETTYETADIAAVLANGVKLGKFEMGEFGAEMQKNIGTAAGLNMSLEETAAANVILQNSFASSEEAGTGLKSMLASLVDPKKVQLLEEMGVHVADSSGKFVGLKSVMDQLKPALAGVGGEVEQQGKLFEIFGSYGVRAAQGLLEQTDALGEYTAEMSDATAVEEMFGVQMESTASKMEIANNKLEAAKIELGEAMAPATEFTALLTGSLADGLSALPDSLQGVAGTTIIASQAFLGLGPAVAGAGAALEVLDNETVMKLVPGLGKTVTAMTGAGGLVPALGVLTTSLGTTAAAAAAIAVPIVALVGVCALLGPAVQGAAEAWASFLGATKDTTAAIEGVEEQYDITTGAVIRYADAQEEAAIIAADASLQYDEVTGAIIENADAVAGTIIQYDEVTGAIIENADAVAGTIIQYDECTGAIIENADAVAGTIIQYDKVTGAIIEHKDAVVAGAEAAAKGGPKYDELVKKIGETGTAADVARKHYADYLLQIGKTAEYVDGAISKLSDLEIAQRTYDGTQATGLDTYTRGLQAGPAPNMADFASPIGYMAALKEWREKISAPKSSSPGKPSSGGSGSDSTEKTWAGKGDPDYTGGDPEAWRTDARLKNEAATATRNYADAVATVAPPTREATASTRELDTGIGALSSTSSAATAPIQAETTAVTGLGSAAPAAATGLTYFRDAQGRLTDMVLQAPVPLNAEAAAVTGAGAAASAATPKVTGLNTGIAGTASAASGATGPVSGLGSAVASTGSQATSAAGQINGATSAINGAKAAAASASSVLAATAGNLGSVAASANTAANSFVSMGRQYLTARNSIQSNPITSIHTIKTIVEGGGANVAPGASATKYYPKFHEGGTYEAPSGQSEGFAKLLDGERVLSRAETKEYEGGGIAAAVAAGIAKGLSAIGLGGGGDVIVHGDVKLSEDYSYDRFREDVGRWKSSRIAKGVL